MNNMNNMKPTIITRKEAKKMAISRDCHCVKGKCRDNNYKECIDKIFDWIEKNDKLMTAEEVLTKYSDGHYTQFKGWENILMAMHEYHNQFKT